MRYKVGDRVRLVKCDIREFIHMLHHEHFGINLPNHSIGTVLESNSCNRTGQIIHNRTLIEFDNYMGGHTGHGLGKDGHCWWIHNMELDTLNGIVIKKSLKRHEIQSW